MICNTCFLVYVKLCPYLYHLLQRWRNERISWDPAQFCGITRISVPKDMIWVPDLIIYEMWAHTHTHNQQATETTLFYLSITLICVKLWKAAGNPSATPEEQGNVNVSRPVCIANITCTACNNSFTYDVHILHHPSAKHYVNATSVEWSQGFFF